MPVGFPFETRLPSTDEAAAVVGWGTYSLTISTRRTWALEKEAILKTRQTAPCAVRVGSEFMNRHPPC